MSYSSAVLADSPSVFLKLDDATTAFVDSSTNGHTQTITATITPAQPGISGELTASALFGGGRIDEDFGSSTAYTALTVEIWYKSTTNSGTLWTSRGTSGAGFTLFVGATGAGFGSPGRVSFGFDGGGAYIGVETNNPFNDGIWHHIVGVFSRASGAVIPGDFSIYIDGQLQTVTQRLVGTGPAVPITPSRNWTIGQHPAGWGGGTFTATNLAAAAIYPTALTGAQIGTHWTEMVATMTTRSALVGSSLEVLTVPAATPVSLEGSSLEVLTVPANTPLSLEQSYLEVLTIIHAPSFKGWGVPI